MLSSRVWNLGNRACWRKKLKGGPTGQESKCVPVSIQWSSSSKGRTQEVEQDYPFSHLCRTAPTVGASCPLPPGSTVHRALSMSGGGSVGVAPHGGKQVSLKASSILVPDTVFSQPWFEDTLPSPPFMFCFEYSWLLVEACGIPLFRTRDWTWAPYT